MGICRVENCFFSERENKALKAFLFLRSETNVENTFQYDFYIVEKVLFSEDAHPKRVV